VTHVSRLQRFATSTCLLRQEGGRWSMERRSLQVEGYQQDLGGGVALTMLKIPAGSFLMAHLRTSRSVWSVKGLSTT
jgi:hypothetical protein